MDIIRFSIENPVKVAVGVILILLFGLISIKTIPVQLTPDVEQPVIRVTTQWPGRSPEEVEREIIEEQEDVLKNISGLYRMTAKAVEGRADIQLEFDVGTDIKSVRQEVSDSLREVREYPDDADEPVIEEGEGGAESPVAWLLLQTTTPDFKVQTLGDPVEDRIKPYLERVKGSNGKGVSEVRVYGGREREVHIDLIPQAIAQRGLTFGQLRDTLTGQNVNTSAGSLKEGRLDISIRLTEQLDDLEQIRNLVVAYDDAGGPIRIRDIARVSLGYEKQRSFVRSRGRYALALPVYRETGANVIQIMEGIRERVKEVNRDVLPLLARQVQIEQGLPAPPELELTLVYEETDYIYDALDLVQNSLMVGGVLAVLVLLLFLRSIRPTLIIALAIPISVIGTFVVMAGFGRNINVISLAGLAFAVGMVVDNAIVVLENIDRHLAMKKKPRAAAYDAAREVIGAIIASTLTTLAVFLPVLSIQEESGQLFRDIALAICAAVSLSLIVSITVIPTAASKFLKTHKDPQHGVHKAFNSLLGLASVFAWLAKMFSRTLHALMAPNAAGVMARLVIVATLTLLSIGGSMLLMPPSDYLPRGNKNLVFGMVLVPPGYNLDQDAYLAERVEKIIQPYWEANSYEDLEGAPPILNPFTQQPVDHIPPLDNYFFVSFFGGVFNGATSKDPSNVAPIAGLMSSATSSTPGTMGFAQQQSLFGRGLSGSRQIDVDIMSTDLGNVLSSAQALQGVLIGKYGPMSVQSDPMNYNMPGPEMTVRIDPVKSSQIKISAEQLGRVIEGLVDGVNVGPYRYQGDSIDIIARRDPSVPMTPDQLRTQPLPFRDASGKVVTLPLDSIAQVERGDAPQQINRVEELRAVTLQVTPPDLMPLETAMQQINESVAGLRAAGAISPDVRIDLAGSASKLTEVREAMLGSWHGWTLESFFSLGLSRIFLALLVTYLLMAALFESFLYPFVIMFSVPLATVGGFIGLATVHALNPSQMLDVLTMLGFIILIGVVVNNAILIVHQALNFMRGFGESEADKVEMLSPREAITESVRTRIRPIFMTTATSVFGMAPLVVIPGAGSELYRGLGSVVIGGLVFSTFFTLVVVPLLFSLMMDLKASVLHLFGGELHEEKATIETA